MKPERGFTLLELLVVLVLVVLIATVAVPGFAQLIEGNRITSTTNSLVGLLNYARAEAIRMGRTVSVVPVGGDYANGVAAQVGGNTLREIEAPSGSISISMSAGAAMTFRGNGLSGQNAEVNYQVCAGSGSRGNLIRVTVGGQIRSEALTCP